MTESHLSNKKLEKMRVFPIHAGYKVTQPDALGYVEPPAEEWGESWWFWCPGCDEATGGHGYHSYTTKLAKGDPPQRPVWTFNGNRERPSFQASMLVRGSDKDGKELRCHLFVTNGKIQYLGDCTHALAGKIIDMVEMP